MKKPVLISLITALFSLTLNAQDLPEIPINRNTIILGIGINQIAVQDQNASPLTQTGKLPQVSFQYKRHYTKGELQIGLQARYGSYYPKAYPNRAVNYGEVVVPIQGKLVSGNFLINYLHQVHASGQGIIQLGAGLQQLFQYPTEAPYAGLVAITSLPLIVRAKHQFNAKNSIESQIQYSLAGLVSRFPWHATLSLPDVTSNLKALYQNNTQLVGGHCLNQFAWKINFQHQISKHMHVGLTYELERLRYPDPRPLCSWSNSFNAVSTFKF